MTAEQLNIAFKHSLPIMYKKPNFPIIRFKKIHYIEYSRQKRGNIHVNVCVFDNQSPCSQAVVELRYIEPCINDYPDDDGVTYSFNTDEPDYADTPPLVIDDEIKDIFTKRLPVEVRVRGDKLSAETHMRLHGYVMRTDRKLKLKFPEIKRLKIYYDHFCFVVGFSFVLSFCRSHRCKIMGFGVHPPRQHRLLCNRVCIAVAIRSAYIQTICLPIPTG